jgi:uncharacterized protein (DUF2236 family)
LTGLFRPGSAIRQVDGEGALLLGGGRAVLMLLAHPLVAQGVADHSRFEADPFARLQRTLGASYTIVFGPRVPNRYRSHHSSGSLPSIERMFALTHSRH